MARNPLKRILKNPKYSVKDLELILKAYEFAAEAHEGQKRVSGEDYIIHPVHVAEYLSDLKMDASTIAAALLHDTIEDTSITEKDLEKKFGKEICFLVRGVTKLSELKHLPHENPEYEQHHRLRKMFLATARDIRVVLIKLADRRHNLQTLNFLDPTTQKRKALETMNIYAPVAGRLGIGELKGELEDLAFPYAFPQEYEKLIQDVRRMYQGRKRYLGKVETTVNKRLRKGGITPVDVHTRAKHYYSLHKKMERKNRDATAIYDLVAIRIILNNIEQCYEAIGLVHKIWKPVPGLIKDYIALPKPNGYQSLHTTVFCEQGKIVEFQLRTPEMHEHAEHGIAAHWAYSEQGKPEVSLANQKEVEWVSKLKKWQNQGPDEFVESLQIDFLSERVFVLTPRGDIKDLPVGSTSVDFAYTIHSEVGDRVSGAKINGKMVSIRQELKTGQIVEIMTSKKASPRRGWLDFVKTSEAKRKIRASLKKNS
jgi:GTP pyrophosphokinase